MSLHKVLKPETQTDGSVKWFPLQQWTFQLSLVCTINVRKITCKE